MDFTVNGEPKKELKSLGDGGVEVVGTYGVAGLAAGIGWHGVCVCLDCVNGTCVDEAQRMEDRACGHKLSRSYVQYRYT